MRAALCIVFVIAGCSGESGDPCASPGPACAALAGDALEYRDLAGHPGLTTTGLSYEPAVVPGFAGAAKAYGPDAPTAGQPIVVLVHGNGSSPGDWERCVAGADAASAGCRASDVAMLAERLAAAGLRAYALDLRTDLAGASSPLDGHTVDHAWSVPLAQQLLESVAAAWPDRDLSVVGFSLGVTTLRDALRRMQRAGSRPFARVRDVVLAAGANHGVATFAQACRAPGSPGGDTMASRCACELGDRAHFTPTPFLAALDGPGGAFETPCADGDVAYGEAGACDGRRVRYTTVVMGDLGPGSFADELVSEASAALRGARNVALGRADVDTTGWFYGGMLPAHFGAIRSEAGLGIIAEALTQ